MQNGAVERASVGHPDKIGTTSMETPKTVRITRDWAKKFTWLKILLTLATNEFAFETCAASKLKMTGVEYCDPGLLVWIGLYGMGELVLQLLCWRMGFGS